jgi:bifunctional non-homologous end joining protein LigD
LYFVCAARRSVFGTSKRADAPYRPGDRGGSWLKTKCLNREEFVVVGWTDPEGSRPHLGALLLAYYAPDGRLVYAGRAGTGMPVRERARLAARLKRLATDRMPLDVPPPRTSHSGSPLVLSRVHWVRPELVAEVTYLEWTHDGLLRQVVYQGLREDKPGRKVRRGFLLPHFFGPARIALSLPQGGIWEPKDA